MAWHEAIQDVPTVDIVRFIMHTGGFNKLLDGMIQVLDEETDTDPRHAQACASTREHLVVAAAIVRNWKR